MQIFLKPNLNAVRDHKVSITLDKFIKNGSVILVKDLLRPP